MENISNMTSSLSLVSSSLIDTIYIIMGIAIVIFLLGLVVSLFTKASNNKNEEEEDENDDEDDEEQKEEDELSYDEWYENKQKEEEQMNLHRNLYM
jgi:cbb3-type cytochrome oxidase subunit 3